MYDTTELRQVLTEVAGPTTRVRGSVFKRTVSTILRSKRHQHTHPIVREHYWSRGQRFTIRRHVK